MSDFKAFFAMLRDVRKKKYPAPWGMFALIFLFVFYFLSPIDLIPDYIFPVLGFADDAAFALFTFAVIRKEVKKYKLSLENGGTLK
ncbi:MAG: DUF1232 domain-containing protein [Elusimicrobium sp.]|nr:DUF1232 domain-containing protein [Elusimicrobium sp.]